MIAVYENESYAVVAKGEIYAVSNKQTGVTELEDRQIANVIQYAEHAAAYLRYKLWRGVAIQAEASSKFLDTQGATSALDTAVL